MERTEQTEQTEQTKLNITQEIYREITLLLIRKKLTVSTMESCTGGLISSLITDTPGASDVIKASVVTYSNEAKINFGVPEAVISEYGVYSEATVIQMAEAARNLMGADIGIGVSGSFGEADKTNADSRPGEVWYAVNFKGELVTEKIVLEGMDSRSGCKLYTADKIGRSLLTVIQGLSFHRD